MDETVLIPYLKNFFSDASDEEISQYLHGLDDTTLSIMRVLISTNIQAQQAIKLLSNKKPNLERTESKSYFTEKQMEKDLKLIRSSTYNARLYLICQETIKQWKNNKQPITRSQIFEEMNQVGPIKAFDEALRYGDTATKIGLVIHNCFQQFYRDEEILLLPTDYGEKLFDFDSRYYNRTTTADRFYKIINTGWLSKSKKQLLKCLADITYSNSQADKEKLSDLCNLHPDNVSRSITQLNQLGFISREPSKMDSKHFKIVVFDKELIQGNF